MEFNLSYGLKASPKFHKVNLLKYKVLKDKLF